MYRNCLFVLTMLSVLFVSTSCITAKRVNYFQDSSMNIPSYNDNIGYEEYTLNPTDKLYIRIYSPDAAMNSVFNGKNQNMSIVTRESSNSELYVYSIHQDGSINVPIVGNITVAGNTLRQVKHKIESLLNTIMVDECAVDVMIVGRYFSIIGGGTNGRYPIFREKMNIFQALALAGDINIYGDRSRIKILRETPHGPDIKTFDIRSKDIINSEFYYIQPNDVIYIQDIKSQFFSVTTFGGALSTIFSTVSFGMLIYNLAAPDSTTETTQETSN